jgi:hypothetical protein
MNKRRVFLRIQAAGHVQGDWLGTEHVLPSFHRGGCLCRMKVGRCHHVGESDDAGTGVLPIRVRLRNNSATISRIAAEPIAEESQKLVHRWTSFPFTTVVKESSATPESREPLNIPTP